MKADKDRLREVLDRFDNVCYRVAVGESADYGGARSAIEDLFVERGAEIEALKAKVEAAEGLYDRLSCTDMQLDEHDWDQDIPVTFELNESALKAARKAGLGGDEA